MRCSSADAVQRADLQPGAGVGQGCQGEQGTTAACAAGLREGTQSSGVARQDIAQACAGGMVAGAPELPALSAGIRNDAAGPLEQHGAAALLGRRRAGLQRR